MPELTINGKDMLDFGLNIEEIRGIHDIPEAEYPKLDVPGADGPLLVTEDPTVAPRILTISARLEVTDPATMDAKVRELGRWIRSQRQLAIITGHDATKVVYGYLKSAPMLVYQPQLVADDAAVLMTIECPDPLVYDVTPTVLTFTTNTAVALGSARSRGVFRITGVTTGVTVTYKNSAGTTISSFTVTPSPALGGGGDYVEVDCRRGRLSVVESRSSVITSIPDKFSGTFIIPDPKDADYTGAPPGTPSWPTLTKSAGTATFTHSKGNW